MRDNIETMSSDALPLVVGKKAGGAPALFVRAPPLRH